MAGRVQGKVAIVTGGSSGIGAATVKALAAEGAAVVAADLDRERGEALVKELGGAACFAHHDVCDEAGWIRLIADTEARFGKLDALVNNAGIIVVADVEETTVEQWRRIHAVNAEGVFLGCKHAIPALRRAGGGSIVNVSSLAALRGTPVYAAYSSSKGAVRSLTKTVALHCRQRGDAIRCNSIHPGGVETPLMRKAVAQLTGVDLDADTAAAAATRRGIELARPEEIASLILYLASDESRYVNGEEIVIDGGLSASYDLTPAGATAAAPGRVSGRAAE
jgi:3(or 17)beta-hydroxysteroid dehydrogenase